MKILITILFFVWSSQAATNVLQQGILTERTRLVWDSNPETDLAGYRVYTFATNASWITPTVATQVFILRDLLKTNVGTNLIGTNIFTFHVTAFNVAGLESGPSDSLVVPLVMAAPLPPRGFQITP